MKVNHGHEFFVLVNTLANNLFGCFSINHQAWLWTSVIYVLGDDIIWFFSFFRYICIFFTTHMSLIINLILHYIICLSLPLFISNQFPFNPGYNQKKDPTYIFCYVDIESLWMDPFPIKSPLLYVSFSDNKSIFSYLWCIIFVLVFLPWLSICDDHWVESE